MIGCGTANVRAPPASGTPSTTWRAPSSASKRSAPGKAPAASTSQASVEGNCMSRSCGRGAALSPAGLEPVLGQVQLRSTICFNEGWMPCAPSKIPRRLPMTEPLVVRRETHITAPPATVFAFLTDPEKIIRWMGTEATMEMHPGGLYLVNGIGDSTARGAFREVVPVHRLAYSFGWEGREKVPPGSSLIEIDLIDHDGGTLLRMTHTGLPDA